MSKTCTICILLILLASCKEAYEPPAIKANNNFLVVDGLINASANGKTTITLSRTRNLVDTIDMVQETNAQVLIEAQSGGSYRLPAASPGVYSNLTPVPILVGGLYRLRIVTQDGKEYVSDFVPAKQTPPIDSLSWEQQNDVTVYLNSHDPQNQAIYYQWDYIETWEYHSRLTGSLGVKNGIMFYTDPTTMTNICWSTAKSTYITTGTSVTLSQDRIDHFPVAFVPYNSEKIGVRYSALINQYTLTEEGYRYWQTLQKNTQQLGTLFDPQPSQLKGNIHCTTNPKEVVIGFVSASSVQSKRIFISNSELINWDGRIPQLECNIMIIPQNPGNAFIYNYPDTAYAPYYFVTGGLVIARKSCVNCTTHGGSTSKPSFW